MELKVKIKIPNCNHLVEWLRFLNENRNPSKYIRDKTYVFDFTKTTFLKPYHLASIACLIEEYKNAGAKIVITSKKRTEVGTFLKYTKFESFWKARFDRNHCFKAALLNTLPILKYENERIDAFATLAQNFYAAHTIPGKDLSPLRLTVVEALNNISDHSGSKVSGFISTQYYKTKSELLVAICDFGKGIPYKVNSFLKTENKSKLKDIEALKKALESGFSTHSTPHNRGVGLDTILSNVNATKGEIEIVSNKAYYSQKIENAKINSTETELGFSFRGTYLIIKLNMKEFSILEPETTEEMNLI